MYSKNDYRYYLENQLMHSDDFLAHYGVKGMKWKHRKNSSGDLELEVGRLGLRFKNPKHAIKDVQNIANGNRKKARLQVTNDNSSGQKRTSRIGTSGYDLARQRRIDLNSKKKTAPNMYSTRRKNHYEKSDDNYTITSHIGSKTYVDKHYGQNQKKADMKADKQNSHKVINERNPYSYDSKKGLKSNIKSNKAVYKRRKSLKKRSDRQIDKFYENA